jgi:hypothetical protein
LQGLLEMALVRQSTIALLKVFQKDNYLEWVLLQIILFQFDIGFTTIIAHQMHHQKYFKKGIYKLFSSGPNFYFVFKDIVLAGLVEGIT